MDDFLLKAKELNRKEKKIIQNYIAKLYLL